jgi:uncharacterized protein (TIGR03118 family)
MQFRMFTRILTLAFVLVVVSGAAQAQYELTNLDSNQEGQSTHPPDPLLVNAWGLARAPMTPWWVSDNESGWSTIYDASGVKQGLEVEIPPAPNGTIGTPTGIVWSPSTTGEFLVKGWPSIFLFDTLDGTISGWAPQSALHDALIAVNHSSTGASYTGLAITNRPSGNILYAADFAHNVIEMYDGSFKHIGSFTDPSIPSGFTVFGVQDINGAVFVTFASASGGPGGFVDMFSESGKLFGTVAQGPPLNQPWGVAAAPADFGPLSNTLLVTNNTNRGTINGFNVVTREFVGAMKDTSGDIIRIDQLWGIAFGGGVTSNGAKNALFFTAGPDNNLAGTFGKIALPK